MTFKKVITMEKETIKTKRAKGENIRLRKDGRWEGRYSKGIVDGKRKQGSVFGKTYEETKEKLIKAKEEFAAMKAKDLAQQEKLQEDTANRVFRLVAEEWYDNIRPTLKPSSAANYRNSLKNWLIPAFGDRPISQISREEVKGVITEFLYPNAANYNCTSHNPLSPKTVSCILSVLKQIFIYADQVKGYPVANLNSVSVKQAKKPLRIFSAKEQKKIEKTIMTDPDNIPLPYFGILLCLYTGIRVGELCALTWGDISKTERTINVNKTMQRVQKNVESAAGGQISLLNDSSGRSGIKRVLSRDNDKNRHTEVVIVSPKSFSSNRLIPIPKDLIPIVEKMRKDPSCFILAETKDKFMEPRIMEYHFHKLMEKCELEGATMHTCRHTFATRCIELGFDPKTLAEILGHSTVNVTLDRYVHPSMRQKAKKMDTLKSNW